MLKVGVPEAVNPELHKLLPAGMELQVIPMKPERPYEIDFWIAPPWPHQAERAWPSLRGVRVAQSTVAGVDALLRLLPRDVVLCDARGVHDISTAEWCVAAVLSVLKYFPLYQEVQRGGLWKHRKDAEDRYRTLHSVSTPLYPNVMLEELYGKRVLIVGFGSIGRAIEERLLPFGVSIERIARTAREGVYGTAALHDLLPAADIIVLIVPATSETNRMIGAAEMVLMKPGALLVNAARGSVVDTESLLDALHAGRIRAAIDVTDPEPLPDGHPLWSAPNLLLTPHVAGSTPLFMHRAMQLAAAQIGRYMRGEPLENVVTGEY